MGLEELKKEILEAANKEAKEIICKAREDSKEIMKEADAKIAEYKEQANNETKKVMGSVEKKETASAGLDIKKMQMEAKKQVIDEVFNGAKEKLASMPAREKEKILNSLVKKAEKEVDIGKIYCDDENRGFFKGMKCKVASEEINGGIIVENEEGTLRLDLSYSTIIENIREKSMGDVGSILFEKR